MMRSMTLFWFLVLVMLVLLAYASYLALDGPLAARAEMQEPRQISEALALSGTGTAHSNVEAGFLAAYPLAHPASFDAIRRPPINGYDPSLPDILDDLNIIGLCESGGDYTLNTGNGFYGKFQFSLETWQAVGGEGYPHLASPQEQDARAGYLLTHYGAGHWPVCGRLI